MNIDKITQKIDRIIDKYHSSSELLISEAYTDGGVSNPAARLSRAAINQLEDESGATLSRYAIWANTVRDNIIEAVNLIKDDPDKSEELLQISANSLSAFSEIQKIFDPLYVESN